jgi:hypothetical protein
MRIKALQLTDHSVAHRAVAAEVRRFIHRALTLLRAPRMLGMHALHDGIPGAPVPPENSPVRWSCGSPLVAMVKTSARP